MKQGTKKKGGKTSKKSTPKKTNKKKTTTTTKKSPKKSGSAKQVPTKSRYTAIQKILSEYCKANGKNLGKDFNKYASLITKQTKNIPLKAIEQNFDEIYKQYVEAGGVPDKVFANNFEWYRFIDLLISDKTFDGVTIGVEFDDGTEKFEFKGFATDMLDYWRNNCYAYFRANYNDSPVAWLRIKDTDGDKFVNYVVEWQSKPPTEGVPTPTSQKPAEEVPSKPAEKPKEVDKEIEIAKAKVEEARAKAEEAKARAEEAKAKAEEKKADTIKDAMQLLKKKVITKKQFDDILKKLK